MPDGASFRRQLEAALEARGGYLRERILPRLQGQLRIFQTLFENLYNILLRKSLINEDPYKYDQKFTEVTVPSRDGFMESEKMDKMSQRLSELHTQVEFLNTSYQFSLEFLTLDRIKRIVGLLQYIHWQRLVGSSPSALTSALAEALDKVRQGSDRMSVGIVNDSLTQIQGVVKACLSMLREAADWQRESYKGRIREQVLEPLSAGGQLAGAQVEAALGTVRRAFRTTAPAEPFYPELVTEILEEELSADGEERRRQVLARLAVAREKREEGGREQSVKPLALEAVRQLSTCGRELGEAVKKLADNQAILDSRRRSFGQLLRSWLAGASGRSRRPEPVPIEYFNSATSATQTEKIDPHAFLEKAAGKARVLAALGNRMSRASARLREGSEEQVFEFLEATLRELQLIHRRLEGLGTYLRSEASREERERMRGIKLELAAVKNAIIRANRQRHEYVNRKEEERQLRRLGIPERPQ